MASPSTLDTYFIREIPDLKRFVLLVFGMFCFGFGSGLFVSSGLGLSPWNVFHQGKSIQFGGTIGMWVVLVSLLILVLWIPLKERMGIGTLMNTLIVGPSIDFATYVFPVTSSVPQGLLCLVAGMTLCGFGSGLYITRNLGAGPRDGLMTALGRRGVPIWIARNSLEATALILGILLGGKAGLGTAVFVICIGPSVQFFMKKFGGKY